MAAGTLAGGGPEAFCRTHLSLFLMLEVGLIGLGAEWEHRYKPALERLRLRMRVRAVHCPVISVAEQVAAELHCDVALGLVTLMERTDVRAIVVLDNAWYTDVTARLACLAGKPAYLAGRLSDLARAAVELRDLSADRGITLVPDFGHRYTPATSRLRELIATRLGRPMELLVEAMQVAESDSRDQLTCALDWCVNLIGTPPLALEASRAEGISTVALEFGRTDAGRGLAVSRVRLHPSGSTEFPPNDGTCRYPLRIEIRCQTGRASLSGAHDISWECPAEKRTESLVGERLDAEVMLDHFLRRVAGGLIPVPTFDDVCRALALAEQVEKSISTGGRIVLPA